MFVYAKSIAANAVPVDKWGNKSESDLPEPVTQIEYTAPGHRKTPDVIVSLEVVGLGFAVTFLNGFVLVAGFTHWRKSWLVGIQLALTLVTHFLFCRCIHA